MNYTPTIILPRAPVSHPNELAAKFTQYHHTSPRSTKRNLDSSLRIYNKASVRNVSTEASDVDIPIKEGNFDTLDDMLSKQAITNLPPSDLINRFQCLNEFRCQNDGEISIMMELLSTTSQPKGISMEGKEKEKRIVYKHLKSDSVSPMRDIERESSIDASSKPGFTDRPEIRNTKELSNSLQRQLHTLKLNGSNIVKNSDAGNTLHVHPTPYRTTSVSPNLKLEALKNTVVVYTSQSIIENLQASTNIGMYRNGFVPSASLASSPASRFKLSPLSQKKQSKQWEMQ
jgi:hypothetical protein